MSLEWYCVNLGYYENGREMFMPDIPSQAAAFLSLFCILNSHKWSSRGNSKRSQTIRVCRLLASPLTNKEPPWGLKCYISLESGESLELGCDGIENASIERGSLSNIVRICRSNLLNGR